MDTEVQENKLLIKTQQIMFNFFKKEEKLIISSSVDVIEKEISTKSIIEEIHETFYTEVDRLLEMANIKVTDYSINKELIDKGDRLKSLGFTNSKEANNAFAEKIRVCNIESENEQKDKLIRAINYFKSKYPLYKFITEDSVKKICEKYNLIYSTVDRYIGEVPDKNLKDIENFKIQNGDCAYIRTTTFNYLSETNRTVDYSDYLDYLKNKKNIISPLSMPVRVTFRKSKLEIAAPKSDFNLKDSELRDFKLGDKHIPDPVVLHPVMFENTQYYLIVTAWGDEASDPLVVNEILN